MGKKSKEQRKKEKRERRKVKREKKKIEEMDLSFNGFDDSMTKSAENKSFDAIKPKTPSHSVQKEEDAIDFDGFSGWPSEEPNDDKKVKQKKTNSNMNLKIEDEEDWDARFSQEQQIKTNDNQKPKPIVKKE